MSEISVCNRSYIVRRYKEMKFGATQLECSLADCARHSGWPEDWIEFLHEIDQMSEKK